jgi:hypothetical protein
MATDKVRQSQDRWHNFGTMVSSAISQSLFLLAYGVSTMHELTATKKDAIIIGYAGMTQDGTILMRLRSNGYEKAKPAVMFLAPGDEKYVQVFAHLGGISPGQTEALTPFSIPTAMFS